MRIFIIILSILFFNQLFSLRLPDGNEAMVSKLKKFPDGKIEYVKLSELVEISLEQEGISYINSEEIWFDKYGNYRKLKGVGSIFSFIIDEFMVGADISEVEFYENKKIKTLGFKRNVSKITNTKKEEDDSEYYVFNYNKEEAIEEIDNYPKINLFDQVCEIKSISLYENQKLMRIVFNSAFYYTDSCNDHTPIYEMFFYPDDNSEHTNYEYYDIRRKKVMFLSTSQEDYIKIDIGNSIIKAKQVLFYRNGTPMYLLLKGNNNNLLYFFNILLSNYLTN
ncbi:MAG: hypothetical protein N2258_03170, partial [Brevinematales bacterium]|nr:hypothetical protein [Brevinematales bacterium]